MSNSSLSLALRIALLIEESSDREMQAAVKLLRDHGNKSGLLDYLGGDRSPIAPKQKGTSTNVKPIEETTSLAVLQLRDVHAEKYRLLSEFDKMVRRGQVLATHEDLRRFGERLSKDFEARKARKDTIGHLMAILAERPVAEIERQIEFAASFGIAGDTDEYQKLAQFLIKGRPQQD